MDIFYAFIITFLPFFVLMGYWLKNARQRDIIPMPKGVVISFVILMTLCMGLYPIAEYSDKERYLHFYMNIYNGFYTGDYKDGGWQMFVTICTHVFQANYNLFFIFVSFIYTFSYYIFAKHQFGEKYMGYFIIMAFGCLGFSGYGTNVIRAGMALGIFLLFNI